MAWLDGRVLAFCGSFAVLAGCDGCDETDPANEGGHGGQGGGATSSSTGSGLGGMNEGGAGGSGGDGGGGASPVDVTVTVLDAGGMPFESIDLIASDAGGALVEHETTDAAGEAVLTVPPGGFISILHEQTQVFWRPPTSRQLYETRTFAIEPGRTALEIRTPRDVAIPQANTPMPSVTIDIPAIPNATEYRLMLSCREDDTLAAGTSSITDYAGCPGETTFDAILAAMDADDHTLAFAFALDQPFTPGVSAALPLVLGSAPLTPVSFDVTDPDMVVSNIIVGAYGTEPMKDPLWADGVDLPATVPMNELGFPSTYPGPDCWLAFGDSFVSASEFRIWQTFRCANGTPGDLEWTVDRLGPATLSLGQKGDASIALLDGDTGDGLVFGLTWSTAGQGGPFWSWTVALPPVETATVPRLELPAELSMFAPPLTDFTADAANVDFAEQTGDFIDAVAGTIPADINFTLGPELAGTTVFVP